MNSAGETEPRSGRGQRISASSPAWSNAKCGDRPTGPISSRGATTGPATSYEAGPRDASARGAVTRRDIKPIRNDRLQSIIIQIGVVGKASPQQPLIPMLVDLQLAGITALTLQELTPPNVLIAAVVITL